MAAIREDRARDLAIRLAGATHSRRLYTTGGPMWERTLRALEADLRSAHEAGLGEVTFALLGDGLAVSGVPVMNPPSGVERFLSQLKRRDVEIIAFKPGVTGAELEVLLAFLSAESADVAAVRGDAWLKERGVDRISIKHLKLMSSKGMESFRDVYRRGGRVLEREFKRAAERGAIDLSAVSELARGLIEVVYRGDAPVGMLLALRDRHDCSMVHSVNVGVLVGHQAAALGLIEDDVQSLSLAGLLHDIGKSRVPEVVLTKQGPLSEEEQRFLDRHTSEGARILLESPRFGTVPPLVAAEHHGPQPQDGLGHVAIELTKIADAFDSVRTLRPFDDPRGMRGAAIYMAERLSRSFNPYLFERFCALAGVFKPGDVGILESGEMVRVIEPHPELGLRPKVEVVERRTGALREGMQLDLGELPQRLHASIPEAFATISSDEILALG